ncbi:DUF4041 domain-containing protein [Romboutsia sp. MSSM.1001216sp_RTP31141st1_G3_RTP31141_220114]|uniref:DUF4041 domain-containing protein n=1 Tax=unclassified Romboutsia TaxID=2626894 RepID=UPI0031B57F90
MSAKDLLEEINKEIEKKNLRKQEIKFDIESLNLKVKELKEESYCLEEDLLMESFGMYKVKYGFENSELYKEKLKIIRNRQKDMIKGKVATHHSLTWTLNNDKKRGKEFILDTVKLILRAFNNECDNIISKVKYSNIVSAEKKIRKVYEDLNKLTDMQNVSIKNEYLKLKLEELYLKHEFEKKLQEEKEEQREIKERMREEAKALKEIELAKKKIEKEETHFNNAINDIKNKLIKASEEDKNKLLNKLEELENKLAEIEKTKEDIVNREKNTRAGYVYIISNIGSFGENIYKIGMTRRLEPMDRVMELGGASVPFKFDVHAMIFSEDAPSLERALHKRFENRSVNRVNLRKEFFKVSLNEIEQEVKLNHNKVVEFTKIAEASEYRQSKVIENNEFNIDTKVLC